MKENNIKENNIKENNIKENNINIKKISVILIVLTILEILLLFIINNTSILKTETTILSILNTNILILMLLTNVYKYYISLLILGLNSVVNIIYYKVQDVILETNSKYLITINIIIVSVVAIRFMLMIIKSIDIKNENIKSRCINIKKNIDNNNSELIKMTLLYKSMLHIIIISIIITEVNKTRFSINSNGELNGVTLIMLICMVIQYILPVAITVSMLFKSTYTIDLANIYIVSYIVSTLFITTYYQLDVFYIINSVVGAYVIYKTKLILNKKDMKNKVENLNN